MTLELFLKEVNVWTVEYFLQELSDVWDVKLSSFGSETGDVSGSNLFLTIHLSTLITLPLEPKSSGWAGWAVRCLKIDSRLRPQTRERGKCKKEKKTGIQQISTANSHHGFSEGSWCSCRVVLGAFCCIASFASKVIAARSMFLNTIDGKPCNYWLFVIDYDKATSTHQRPLLLAQSLRPEISYFSWSVRLYWRTHAYYRGMRALESMESAGSTLFIEDNSIFLKLVGAEHAISRGPHDFHSIKAENMTGIADPNDPLRHKQWSAQRSLWAMRFSSIIWLRNTVFIKGRSMFLNLKAEIALYMGWTILLKILDGAHAIYCGMSIRGSLE